MDAQVSPYTSLAIEFSRHFSFCCAFITINTGLMGSNWGPARTLRVLLQSPLYLIFSLVMPCCNKDCQPFFRRKCFGAFLTFICKCLGSKWSKKFKEPIFFRKGCKEAVCSCISTFDCPFFVIPVE